MKNKWIQGYLLSLAISLIYCSMALIVSYNIMGHYEFFKTLKEEWFKVLWQNWLLPSIFIYCFLIPFIVKLNKRDKTK